MISVLDVAAFILHKCGSMTSMKLQKLVYYSQAWSLVWDETPIFSEPIEAWANGPVVRKLYNSHRGKFKVRRRDIKGGNARKLDPDQRNTVESVIKFYGNKSSQALVTLTHAEKPWRRARNRSKCEAGDRCSEEILHSDMAEYYGSLDE